MYSAPLWPGFSCSSVSYLYCRSLIWDWVRWIDLLAIIEDIISQHWSCFQVFFPFTYSSPTASFQELRFMFPFNQLNSNPSHLTFWNSYLSPSCNTELSTCPTYCTFHNLHYYAMLYLLLIAFNKCNSLWEFPWKPYINPNACTWRNDCLLWLNLQRNETCILHDWPPDSYHQVSIHLGWTIHILR